MDCVPFEDTGLEEVHHFLLSINLDGLRLRKVDCNVREVIAGFLFGDDLVVSAIQTAELYS